MQGKFMTRKKKKKIAEKRKTGESKPPKAFHPAFSDLAHLKKKRPAPVEIPKKEKPSRESREMDEDQYFLEKMSDVVPLSGGPEKIVISPNEDLRPVHPARNDDMEAVAHLCDLVSGSAPMDITFSDEYMEGSRPGI